MLLLVGLKYTVRLSYAVSIDAMTTIMMIMMAGAGCEVGGDVTLVVTTNVQATGERSAQTVAAAVESSVETKAWRWQW